MILNEKTIKEGMTLYTLYAFQNKVKKFWRFRLESSEVERVEEVVNNKKKVVLKRFRNNNTNDSLPYQCFESKWFTLEVLTSNETPYIKYRHYITPYCSEYIYYCDSYQTLVKFLKKLIFNGKGNETTRRIRLKIYRELVRQWTISPYKENLSIRISYEL